MITAKTIDEAIKKSGDAYLGTNLVVELDQVKDYKIFKRDLHKLGHKCKIQTFFNEEDKEIETKILINGT